MPDPIVIAGGGFAGFWAAIAARAAAPHLPIRLVSRGPVLEMRPRLYEAAPETLGMDIRPLLDRAGVEFVQAEIVALSPDALTLADGAALPFARLVLASGSILRRPPIPGAEAAFSIDTQAEAIAFDHRLAELAAAPAPRVAVVGAGFTGLELALELRDRLAVHGGAAAGERLAILLLDSATEPGAELGPGPRPAILAALDQARVERHMGVRVAGIDAGGVVLADGRRLAADAVVLTTGMVAAPLAAGVPGARDALGRVVVDAHLRAPAAPRIFVTGDAAAADTGDGHIALQSCQHALRMGRFAGANAARDLLGQPLVPYAQLRYVTCLDLGRYGAVRTEGWERRTIEAGPAAKPVKRRINTSVIYPPAAATRDELLALAAP